MAVPLLSLAAAGVQAQERPKATEGYAGDSAGYVVVNSDGNCVRTSSWTKASAIPFCEPGMFPKKEAMAPPPPPPPAPMPKPAPQPVLQSVTLTGEALFDHDKSTLKPAGMQALDSLATQLKQYQRVDKIIVTGYTDSQGSEQYNQRLSQRRAAAVMGYLVSRGVPNDLIETRGMGEANPVADNGTKAGRAKNRRVEIDIQAVERVQ
jgi:OOP family OmpA-OmpF porin